MKKSIRTVPQKAVLFFLSALLIVSSLSWYSSNSKVSALTSADLSFSDNGVKFICDREQFHATCYVDYSQSSIGYGTKCTGSSQQPHAAGTHSITREQALAEMKSQISSTYAPKVRNQTVGITMNQNQFDALVSLAYNTGGGTTLIANSPLVRYLKGELTEAQARQQYSNYKITAGGEVNSGLINRRNAEADLFFTPCSSGQNDNFVFNVEGAQAAPGGVAISGWCFDKRNTAQTLKVHVYFGGPAGSSGVDANPFTDANKTRTDVDNVHHCGPNHGFETVIYTTKRGSTPVYIYAVNPSNNESTLMFSFTVDISNGSDFNFNFEGFGAVTGGGVAIEGWVYDRNHTGDSIGIHTYIGGRPGTEGAYGHPHTVANKERTDVDNVHHCGANHGFQATIYSNKTGSQPVYVYAVSPTTGESVEMFSFMVDIPVPNDPEGMVDDIIDGTGRIRVRGWAFDRDDLSQPIDIHVYIGGKAGSSGAEVYGIKADALRTDVDNAHHVGTNHGFDAYIPTAKTGIQDIYIYGINLRGGQNVLLGSGQAAIAADTEAPVVNNAYSAPYLGEDAYTVYIDASDNVAVQKVVVGTWINGAMPPDESNWAVAKQNADGLYYVEVQRSQQSQTGNSFYNNQFYVYDYAGHKTFGTANMDYSIVSNTGKNIPEGEYRIYSATDPAKALDVYGASVQDNANVDIYANTGDSKQTFRLTYAGNGFYTIFNTNANKPVDVFGDTYAEGTNVCISSYHEGANQQWMFRLDSDGLNYNIVERANGNLLTVESGGNVAVYKENGSEAQKWRLARVLNSTSASFTIVDPVVTPGYSPAPQVFVKVDGVNLTEGFDYTAEVTSYSNGSGVVTVTGIGSYCDSVNINFTYTERPVGDITMDGIVNIDDATELQRALAEFFVLSDEQTAVADVDKNGKINIRDVTQIQRIAAELE